MERKSEWKRYRYNYMDEKSREQALSWATALSEKKKIRLIKNKSDQSSLLEQFCDQLSGLSPLIEIEKKRDIDASEPYIAVNEFLRFKAVPEEKMLGVFLHSLTVKETDVMPEVVSLLADFNAPVDLKIYITPFCPFCPGVVSELSQLSAVPGKEIRVDIIDGSLFPELAAMDAISSAPTVLFNENFRWTGQVAAKKVAEVIGNTSPESLSSDALRTLVESGRAGKLAQFMIEADKIFPAFYELLTHEKWPVRLGAMVTVEEIASANTGLAEEVLRSLWQSFNSFSETVKGDIIYMTGETGLKAFVMNLEEIVKNSTSDDLIDAATEALATLNPFYL